MFRGYRNLQKLVLSLYQMVPGLNSGTRAWWQVPLPTEPSSHWPLNWFFWVFCHSYGKLPSTSDKARVESCHPFPASKLQKDERQVQVLAFLPGYHREIHTKALAEWAWVLLNAFQMALACTEGRRNKWLVRSRVGTNVQSRFKITMRETRTTSNISISKGQEHYPGFVKNSTRPNRKKRSRKTPGPGLLKWRIEIFLSDTFT